MPRLLVDSDLFCKLGIAGLLESAVMLFGVPIADCGCLPALHHMLRRGKLRRTFGGENCDRLITPAERMAAELSPSGEWLDKLTGVDRIDIGEAMLFATIAVQGIVVMTGDKRALAAVAHVQGYPEKLAGRIATLEAILLSLCGRLGDGAVRAAVQPLLPMDRMIQICFSADNRDSKGALRSYFDAAKRDVAPLRLWEPTETST